MLSVGGEHHYGAVTLPVLLHLLALHIAVSKPVIYVYLDQWKHGSDPQVFTGPFRRVCEET